jgi:hypothetical protein
VEVKSNSSSLGLSAIKSTSTMHIAAATDDTFSSSYAPANKLFSILPHEFCFLSFHLPAE